MTSLNGFRNLDGPDSIVAACFEDLNIPTNDDATNILSITTLTEGNDGEGLMAACGALPEGHQVWAFSPTPAMIEHPALMVTVLNVQSDEMFAEGVRLHLAGLLADENLRASAPSTVLARHYCPECEWVGLDADSHATLAEYRSCDPAEALAILR